MKGSIVRLGSVSTGEKSTQLERAWTDERARAFSAQKADPVVPQGPMIAFRALPPALVLMLCAVVAGVIGGFLGGGRGALLEATLPVLMAVTCVEQLRIAAPSARWTVPLLMVGSLLNALVRSGPTPARVVIATVCSTLIIFSSVTQRRAFAIVVTLLACGYSAALRGLAL